MEEGVVNERRQDVIFDQEKQKAFITLQVNEKGKVVHKLSK